MSKKSVIKTKINPKIAVTVTVLAILIVGIFAIATILSSSRLGGFTLNQTHPCLSFSYVLSAVTNRSFGTAAIVSLPSGCLISDIGFSSGKYYFIGDINNCNWGSGANLPEGVNNVEYYTSPNTLGYSKVGLFFRDMNQFGINYGTCRIILKPVSGGGDGGGGDGGGSGTTQYYCDRTDPVKPWCRSGYPPQPGLVSYPQCMDSCVPSRDWVDININPKQTKYQTGQIIKFLPQSNILSRLTKFSWNFDDGIKRFNEPYREQPVVYSEPGRKNITLSVIDPQTNNLIATTTQIRVKCVPPSNAVPGDELITITSYLNNNQMVKIAANNFREWARDNEQEISDAMYQSQCEYLNRDKMTEYKSLRAIQWIKNITDVRQIAVLGIQQLMPSAGQNRVIAHAIIALKVTDITDNFETRYSIDFLDSNGPTVMSMDCKISKQRVWDMTDNTVKLQTALFCLHPTFDLVYPRLRDIDTQLIESLRTKFYQNCNLSQTSFCQERRNLGLWLRNNYPLITNFDPVGSIIGVCQGWSEFVSKVSYLGDFAGECASF